MSITTCFLAFFFFKQKTAYEMRISDWSSDVCSSDLWPANVIHDGSDQVVGMFPDSNGQQGDLSGHSRDRVSIGIYGDMGAARDFPARRDDGSAARFFYSAKAGPLDRIGTAHATVKPVDLMRWLVRLVTPPGGRVLDPFAGSGTPGLACHIGRASGRESGW